MGSDSGADGEVTGPRIFVDTNSLLHFHFPTDVDWCAVSGCDRVTLVIAPVVVRELEKHKIGGNARLKKRATNVLKRLHEIFKAQGAHGSLRNGVTYELLTSEPLIDFSAHQFERTLADDWLLAAIFQEQSLGRDVRLVTEDLSLIIKAHQRRIACVRLPDTHRLAEEEDALEKENRQLRAELEVIRAARPKLKLTFADGSDRLSFSVPSPELVDEESEMASARGQYPLPHEPFPRGVLGLRGIFQPFGTEEERRSAILMYREDFRRYLSERNRRAQRRARSVEFDLILENEGTRPGEVVSVTLFIPDDMLAYGPHDVPNEPEPPAPPSLLAALLQGNKLLGMDVLPGVLPRRTEPSIVFDAHGHRMVWQIGMLRHEHEITSGPLYIEYPGPDPPWPFHIEYKIFAANIPVGPDGKLHFVPE